MLNTSRSAAARISGVALITFLGGCQSVVEHFADRAVNYDIQAERIRDQAMLLNVVRAVYRKPMQFVDVGAMTGTATLSGTAAFSFPWLLNSGSTGTGSFGPTGTLSGGPSFTITPLTTSEFYKGIMSPVSVQELAYFIDEGMSPKEIFRLAIERITFTYTDKNHSYSKVYTNDWVDPKQTDSGNFGHILDYLISARLTAEDTSTSTAISPPLLSSDLRDPSKLRGIPSTSEIKRYDNLNDDKNLTKDEKSFLVRAGTSTYFRLESKNSSAKFCFHPREPSIYYPFTKTKLYQIIPYEPEDTKSFLKIIVTEDNYQDIPYWVPLARLLCPAMIDKGPGSVSQDEDKRGVSTLHAADMKTTVKIDIAVRSVEGMLYHLGELSRYKLLPAGPPKGGGEPYSDSYALFNLQKEPEHLQTQCSDSQGGNQISVCYEGQRYWVDVNSVDNSSSFHVLSVLSQLIALNNSAKDLPAPNTVTLISH